MKHIGRTLAIAALAACALTACSSGPDSDRDSSTSETRALGTTEETAAVISAPPMTSAIVGSADTGAEESADTGAEESAPQSYSNPSTSVSPLTSPGEDPPTGAEIAETTELAAPAEGHTPEEIVAEAGPRGQDYLRAIRARGVPALGMDSVEISFANGTCTALASGMPRIEVLNEFDSVGQALATGAGLEPGQIAEAYVSAAEQTYC
jgi:hypothetical protein